MKQYSYITENLQNMHIRDSPARQLGGVEMVKVVVKQNLRTHISRSWLAQTLSVHHSYHAFLLSIYNIDRAIDHPGDLFLAHNI